MPATEDGSISGTALRPRWRLARDSGVLAAGSALAGLLAYVFFALVTRTLGADRAAPVSVLWTYWALAAAVLTFTVQHWTIRTLAHDRHEGTVARTLPMLAAAAGTLSVAAGIVTFAFRDELFADDGLIFPALIAGTTMGSFFVGLVRGALAGRRRYVATAASLAGEHVVRVAAASVLAVTGGGPEAFGIALVAGQLIGLVWLGSLRFERSDADAEAVRNPLALASGVAGGSLLAQVVLTGAPVVLAALGGAPAAVTSMFVALAVWRAPYIVALGVTPQITGVLTRLTVRGQVRRLNQLRWMTVLGVALGCGAAMALGTTILPDVLRLAFGADVEMRGSELTVLGVGTALALGNLVLLLMLLAYGRSRAATVSWLGAVAFAGGFTGVSSLAPEPRVATAFLVAQGTAFVLLLVAGWRPPAQERAPG
jgi:O-antigen/teichoic acid export membrane protein